MCEIMTVAAAALFTVLYFTRCRTRPVFTTMMMFWGAALMWSVDCMHGYFFPEEGEAPQFFDLSREDALLGVIVLAAGLFVFAILAYFDHAAKAADLPAELG